MTNIASNSDVQVFSDATGEYSGFAGTVLLYDSAIYIDTRNGKGYDKAIDKLAPLVHKFLSKFYFDGNSKDDTKQDVIVHILEGIPKYDPRKESKLSTFIEMRVMRRLINELRDKNRVYKNATFLNISSYRVTCDCGNIFSIVTCDENEEITCKSCGNIAKTKKPISINAPEVNETMLQKISGRREEKTLDELSLSDYSIVGTRSGLIEDKIIMEADIVSIMEDEDPKLSEIVSLIYFHDYSIKAAAEKVGMTSAGANLKLKKLRKNRAIRQLFNR